MDEIISLALAAKAADAAQNAAWATWAGSAVNFLVVLVTGGLALSSAREARRQRAATERAVWNAAHQRTVAVIDNVEELLATLGRVDDKVVDHQLLSAASRLGRNISRAASTQGITDPRLIDGNHKVVNTAEALFLMLDNAVIQGLMLTGAEIVAAIAGAPGWRDAFKAFRALKAP